MTPIRQVPGFEKNYEEKPAVETVTITISRISAEALVDGDVSTEARNACFAALKEQA